MLEITVALLAAFLGIVSCVLVMLFFVNYKQKRDLKNIMKYIEGLLSGIHCDYLTYEDTEMSRIVYLLACIAQKQTLLKEEAYEEKESIKGVIANLSHQLKTPLSNVKLYFTFLEDNTLPFDKREDFQYKIKKQIEKIEWIISSLFKCVRLEEGAISFESKMLPIHKTIIQALDTIALKAEERHIEVIAENDIENILLYHNCKWTAEVFVNILENAIKYSNEYCTIKIEVEQLETYTHICFKDQGIGIKKEEMSKIFQRFYRSKDVENKEGSGIGLYLCRLILEKEKGDIFVKSEYGAGSEFQVYLLNKNTVIGNL